MLKKLSLYSVLFAITLGFSACNSDDDDIADGNIVGKWICVESWEIEDGKTHVCDEDIDYCMVLLDDGTGYECYKEELGTDDICPFQYIFTGETLTIKYKFNGDGNIGNYPCTDLYMVEWLNPNKIKLTYYYKDKYDDEIDVYIYERF